jgi:hypothetical protein
MPGARCTRGLVCKLCVENAHEHTGEAEASDIPCAMALRLMPRSPGRRVLFVTLVGEYGLVRPGRADKSSADLASATDARTTRFCRTLQRRSSARRLLAHGPFASPPCDRVSCPALSRPPHPAPTLVTMADAPQMEQDGNDIAVIGGIVKRFISDYQKLMTRHVCRPTGKSASRPNRIHGSDEPAHGRGR